MTPLGFVVENGNGDRLDIEVPSFRQADVTREIDLIEEVCRLNGYDKIPAILPSATFAREAPVDTLNLLRSFLGAQGLSEAWLSSLVPGETPGLSEAKLVSVLNPLSKDHQALRQSLVPGLLQAAAYNQNHGAKSVWLFENGRVYLKEGDLDKNTGTGVKESRRLAGIICGEKIKGESVDYYQAKGLVENLFESLGIDSRRLPIFSARSTCPGKSNALAASISHWSGGLEPASEKRRRQRRTKPLGQSNRARLRRPGPSQI